MSNLVLELRQGDMMVVNGAAIRFRSRTRIELTAHARFLFGRQIMPPQEANTPARRLYYALQTAYIGDDDERSAGLAEAAARAEEFKQATTSALAVAILDQAMSCALGGRCYQALRLARRVIQHEDAVLGRPRHGAPKRLEAPRAVALGDAEERPAGADTLTQVGA
jgi:flagellar protein FlbT